MSAARIARRLARGAGGLAVAGTLALGLLAAGPAAADDVKLGILFDVTGPIASYVPPILDAVKLAVDEVNANGGILKGQKLQMIVGDTQGTAQGAIDAATKLVSIENVAAIVGALTSGATVAAANGVSIPNGVLQISPTATTPQLTGLKDKDFVFRVEPSDAFQGPVLAKLVYDHGLKKVALAYVNSDYGVGIASTFRDAYVKLGGTITADQAHEPNKSSYRAELATLAAGKPEALVLIAYAGGSGITIIKQALENGFFTQFVGTDGLRGTELLEQVGADNLKGMLFTSPAAVPGTAASDKFEKIYTAAYKTTKDKYYIAQTYDAVMLAALAIEQAGSTDRTKIRDALRQVCCAPGEAIEPGEWAKAKAAIAAGKKIDYNGAAGPADFDANGDVAGAIGEFVIENGNYKQLGVIAP